jgi:hypothetical protein
MADRALKELNGFNLFGNKIVRIKVLIMLFIGDTLFEADE